jgi:hypothetical protein
VLVHEPLGIQVLDLEVGELRAQSFPQVVLAVRASVKRRARPSSLSLVRLVSRLACAWVAAICPLPKMVKGIRFTADPAGQVAARY